MMLFKPTHAELVAAAAEWLWKSCKLPTGRDDSSWYRVRCAVVITEMGSAAWEEPDAIGWTPWCSVLVECKAYRSDFLSDVKKPTRRHPETGMGGYRYYLAPKGLLSVDEIPPGWGLLEYDGKTVRVRKIPLRFQNRAHDREMALLVSALRRVPATTEGVRVRVYTDKGTGEPRAALYVTEACEERLEAASEENGDE